MKSFGFQSAGLHGISTHGVYPCLLLPLTACALTAHFHPYPTGKGVTVIFCDTFRNNFLLKSFPLVKWRDALRCSDFPLLYWTIAMKRLAVTLYNCFLWFRIVLNNISVQISINLFIKQPLIWINSLWLLNNILKNNIFTTD